MQDRMYAHTDGGSRQRKLSEKMSDVLFPFMHSGNPNSLHLPNWQAFTVDKGETKFL
ncbi:hypothetical protein [Cecembia calidifontis]|uniref:hypothetical protein n=1 Tax=Cecembia calidifontis TaxID=1187080 RepID=UPI001F5F7C12|nr:hypothetical protein [Cecembia calidifontis]